MSFPFLNGDPIWIPLHGAPRRANFIRFEKCGRCKVRTEAGIVRTVKVADVSYRNDREGRNDKG